MCDVTTESESLGYQLFKQFISLQRGSIDQYYRAGAKRLDLRVGEFTTLLQIYLCETEDDPATVSSLATLNHCTKSNISQITKILEKKQYIVRRPSQKDHRTMYLTLSEPTREIFENNEFFGRDVFVKVIERLGIEKSQTFLSLLREFTDIYKAMV